MGAYKNALDKTRAGMSPEQIHAAKKARKKERRAARKALNLSLAAERVHRSPQEQRTMLDWRLGRGVGAKKERARLDQKSLSPSTKTVA